MSVSQMQKRLALTCAAFISFAHPASAIIDQKVSCLLGDERVLITTGNSKTTLLQGVPIDLRIGHFDIGNCLLSSIILESGVRIEACAVADITATFPRNMDFFIQSEDIILWSHFNGDPQTIPVEVTLDCLTNQGLK